MKTFTKLLILGGGLWAGTACADLTAVVTPGYQFPLDGSVAPSYPLLNLLATPTIAIYGTVGGSNTLAAGSVTGVQLNSSVADGTTIGFNGNNPPGLQTLGAGIAGPGLTNNGTTGLTLWVDTNLFTLATNSPVNTNSGFNTPALTFKTNGITANLLNTNAGILPGQLSVTSGFMLTGGPLAQSTNGWNPTNGFATLIAGGLKVTNATYTYYRTNADSSVTTVTQSGPVLVDAPFVSGLSNVYTTNFNVLVAHGLGQTPQRSHWVLVCQTTELGYPVGAEVDIEGVGQTSFQRAIATGYNATNAWLFAGGSGWYLMPYNATGAGSSLSAQQALGSANNQISNWKLKVYVWP